MPTSSFDTVPIEAIHSIPQINDQQSIYTKTISKLQDGSFLVRDGFCAAYSFNCFRKKQPAPHLT